MTAADDGNMCTAQKFVKELFVHCTIGVNPPLGRHPDALPGQFCH
jgi:hypothetical protein